MGTIRPNRGRAVGIDEAALAYAHFSRTVGPIPVLFRDWWGPEPTTLLLERVQKWPAALPANEPHRDRPGDLHARITPRGVAFAGRTDSVT
jgi:hypothetical protein